MRFLEALDAAIAEKSTSGGGEMSEDEKISPLVEEGKFKTHPLGIGTCASEYSELTIVGCVCVCASLFMSYALTTSSLRIICCVTTFHLPPKRHI